MRRALVALTVTLTLAACSPYDTPADAAPDLPITTSTVRSGPSMLYSAAICDRACWERIVARQHAERAWWAEVVANQRRARDWRRLLAHLEAQRRAEAARRTGGAYVQGIEVCNGRTLPTCGIVRRESGFNPRAENPTSTASGLFQFLDSTWRRCPHRGGVGHAAHATVATQVACARWLWAGGAGRSHWSLTA